MGRLKHRFKIKDLILHECKANKNSLKIKYQTNQYG